MWKWTWIGEKFWSFISLVFLGLGLEIFLYSGHYIFLISPITLYFTGTTMAVASEKLNHKQIITPMPPSDI